MVWRNALTEYYNATNSEGISLSCVYTSSSGDIVRDATKADCDSVTASSTAKGFRLPTSAEWELAARYQDGTIWTEGDHVSGDTTGYCYNSGISTTASTIFGNYGWYWDNSGSSTHTVGQITANALNIKDMTETFGNGALTGILDMKVPPGWSAAGAGTMTPTTCRWAA